MDMNPSAADPDQHDAPAVPAPPIALDAQAALAALATARRSRTAATRPQIMPAWYGPTIGVFIATAVAISDLARELNAPWLISVASGAYAVGVALVLVAFQRQQGVVAGFDRRYVAPSIIAMVCCVGIGLLAYGGAYAAGIWARGTIAGIAAGLVFWIASILINNRIRRDVAVFDAAASAQE